MAKTTSKYSPAVLGKAPWWPILLGVLLRGLLVAAQIPGFQYVNPVQVKIDPFLIKLGPTNTPGESPVTLVDAEVALGVVEDLISEFCQEHYEGNDDTFFKYTILALVNIWEESEDSTSTILEFTGGVSYFEGISSVLPSQAEMQMLVDISLSDEALLEALSESFPYITEAAYAPQSDGFEDAAAEDDEEEEDQQLQEENDEAAQGEEEGDDQDEEEDANSELIINQAIQDKNVGSSEQEDGQPLVAIASACSGAFVFAVLLATLVVKQNSKRKALWRDDAVKDDAGSVDDLALDGYCDPISSNKKRKKKGTTEHQSLHMRDSLREMVENDAKSDAGSSFVGRLLNSAAAAIPACTSRDEGEDTHHVDDNDNDKDKANNSRGSGDTHSSSDISEKSDTQSNNGDASPSEFEGNAIVKPNLIPISDPASFDDDVHDPLPPSRIASARRDEMPIRLSTTQQEHAGDDASPGKRKYTHESFLAKYWNPLTGNILPLGSYFGGGGGDHGTGYAKDDNSKGDFTPRTPATDMDAGWSDISSDHHTEDFELDQAWDPDDASLKSGETDQEVFSPMARTLSQEDKVELLRASPDTKYNLERLRTPPSKVRSAQAERRVFRESENTAAV